MDVHPAGARYDGIADWYDLQLDGADHRDQVLLGHLPHGAGAALDVGCGTGRTLALIAEHGWNPIGVELSTDQLRIAQTRAAVLIQGDAERLPIATSSVGLVVSAWTSTDVDHFDRMLAEIARVLIAGGRYLFYGVHPCFNGPHVESTDERTRIVHPSYREARRHTSVPWWGHDGIRTKVGGMRHVPLAEFLNAHLDAGLRLDRVAEPDDEPVPYGIVLLATKPSQSPQTSPTSATARSVRQGSDQ